MPNDTIDTLNIEISSSTAKAVKALGNLSQKLSGVNEALQSVNTGGLRNYARDMGRVSASIKALNGIKVNIPNLSGLSKQLKDLGDVDFSKLTSSAQPLKDLASGLQSLSGLQNISIPKLDAKNIDSVVGAVEKLSGIDTSKISQVKNGIEEITKSVLTLSGMNTKNTGINTTISSLKRLMEIETKGFSTRGFSKVTKSISSIANIPDVSNSVNRLVSSFAKLASAGEKTGQASSSIAQLGVQLRKAIINVSGIGNVSDSVNLFVQSIGKLASAGNKTGQTAGQLKSLASETLSFFNVMKDAPHISENTIRMTEALAKLASAGGKVNTSANTITGAFGKLSASAKNVTEHLKKTWGVILKATAVVGKLSLALLNPVGTAKKMGNVVSSAFQKIGLSSKHLNTASFSLGKLFKSALLLLGIRQIFNWGKQAMEISSDLTEVQNVVDVTFGDMKQKVEDLASISITDFGMSELTTKQISSRFQAMGVSMGFSQEKMSDMSIELTKLAADMASFYNVEQSDMAKSLQSVFTGEAEPMRRYGIDLTQTTLQEYALAKGITTKVSAMSQAEKTMLRYQYVMENTTAAQGDFLRTSDSWANQTRILKQSFEALASTVGGTLINAFKPLVKVLNSVLQKVISFAETVSEALGAIFGWKLEISGGGITDDLDYAAGSAEDLADSADNAAGGLGGATGAAQKLKKALSVLPFDKLNQLASNLDNTGSGGSGGGSGSGAGNGGAGAGSGASANLVETDSIFKKYESDIKNLEQLGEYIGDALTKAMQKIDWNKIYAEAQNFGTGLADFLNGLISPELFGETGRLIANSLNTALYVLNSFGERFDFSNFGLSIATGLNKFFRNFKFGLLADTIDTWANGLLTAMDTGVNNLEWDTIGKRIAEAIKKTLKGINWETAYSAASGFGTGLATFLNKLITPSVFAELGSTAASSINTVISGAYSLLGTIEWEQWGESIGTSLNNFFSDFDWETAGLSLDSAVNGVLDMLIKAAQTTHWEEFGDKVVRMLKQIRWREILSKIGELIWDAINAGIKVWKKLFDEYPVETTIVTALIGLKFTGLGSLLGNNLWKKIKESIMGGAATKAADEIASGLSRKIVSKFAVSMLGKIAPIATIISGTFTAAYAQVKVDEITGGTPQFISTLSNWMGEKFVDIAQSDSVKKGQEVLQNIIKKAFSFTGKDITDNVLDEQPEIEVSIEVEDNTQKGIEEAKLSLAELEGVDTTPEIEAADNTEGGIESAKSNLSTVQEKTVISVSAEDKTETQISRIKSSLLSIPLSLAINFIANTNPAITQIGNVVTALFGLSQNSETAEQKSGLLSTTLSGLKDGSWAAQLKMLILNASTKTLGENADKAAGNTKDLGTSLDRINSSGAKKELKELTDQINSLSDNAKKGGDNWTKGLANGITNSVPTLQTGIKSITDTIIGDTQTQLGEHSPSTISYGFGQNWIQGFINGHDSLKNTLLTNISYLYNDIKKKFSTSFSDFSGIGKNIIRGLQDGLSDYSLISDATKQIKSNISSAFNNYSLYNKGQKIIQSLVSGMKSVYIPRPYMSFTTSTTMSGNSATTTTTSNVGWHKDGGLFYMPSIIGVGEAGKEAVLPLENQRTMSMIADSIVSNASGMGVDEEVLTNAVARGVAMAMMNNQQNPINVTCYAELKTENDEVLARAVTRGQQKIDYRMNPTPKFA